MNKFKTVMMIIVSWILIFCGGFLVFLYGLGGIVFLLSGDLSAIILIFIALLGIWILNFSIKTLHLIRDLKFILSIHERNISDIASTMSLSEDAVMKKLEVMIARKYLINAYIDRNSNRLVILSEQEGSTKGMQFNANLVKEQNVEMVSVNCKNCGAVNLIPKGGVGECEYCGSPIKGE